MIEDKRREDKFLNNEKNLFSTFRFETQFKISPQIIFSEIRLFVSKLMKHETTNIKKTKKNQLQSRAFNCQGQSKDKFDVTVAK